MTKLFKQLHQRHQAQAPLIMRSLLARAMKWMRRSMASTVFQSVYQSATLQLAPWILQQAQRINQVATSKMLQVATSTVLWNASLEVAHPEHHASTLLSGSQLASVCTPPLVS